MVKSKVLASTLHAEPAEQPIGHTPIGFDLLTQRVDVWKLTFVSHTLHESQAHRAPIQVARIPKQMRLDGQFLFAEGGTDADVCEPRMDDAIDRRRRRIDTMWWNQLVRRLQIGGRKPNLASTPPPGDHDAVDVIRVSEQGSRFVDPTLCDQTPYACAAHDEVFVAYRVDLVSPETVMLAERAQHCEVAAPPVAKQKVGSNPNLRHPQPVHQHGPNERLRVPLRQLASESHDGHTADARAMERLEPLAFRHQQLRCLVRPQNARWMRIEGHRHRRAAMLGGATPDALADLAMAAMQTVEIAERQNRMHQPRRSRVVREVDGFHSLHVDSHVEHEPIICQFDAGTHTRTSRR